MHNLTLKEKTARGIFWGGLSSGLQQILGLVLGIILARILDVDNYGIIGMLAIFSAMAGSIQDSGFSTALINRKEINHEDYNAVFWFNIFISISLYAILYFCAPLIAQFYERPELIKLSRFLFIGIIFSSFGITHNALLIKKMMVKKKAMIDIMSLIISGILGITTALSGMGYWALAIQSTIYIICGTLLRWYFSPWRPSFQLNFKPLNQMVGFSIQLFFTNIYHQIVNNTFSVLLGKFYTPIQVGYYSQGYKWAMMGGSFLSNMMMSVAQPVLVQAHNERERQKAIFRKMIRFGSFISFPLMLGLAFVSKEFIYILVGEKWLESSPFLQLFCIWGSIGFLWILYSNLLFTHGKATIHMYGVILVGILQLSVLAGLFKFGIIPMLIGYISMYFVGLLFWQYFINKMIGLRLWEVIKDTFPYLGITFFCFVISWIVTRNVQNIYLTFFIKTLLSASLYILIMKISNSVIFRESIDFLFKRK